MASPSNIHLLPQRSVPRPGERAPDHVALEGYELAVTGDMKSMSLEGRKALWRAGQAILEAEHHGQAVLQVHVVTALATSDARG